MDESNPLVLDLLFYFFAKKLINTLCFYVIFFYFALSFLFKSKVIPSLFDFLIFLFIFLNNCYF